MRASPVVLFSLFLLCLVSVQDVHAGKKNDGKSRGRQCGRERCRAGHECSTNPSGEKVCICRRYCNQRERYVCGSDGFTYLNKCELHRIGCVQKRPLKVRHTGRCPSEADDTQPEMDNKAADVGERSRKKTAAKKLPLVCYQMERDELRQLLVDDIKTRGEKQGKTYRQLVAEDFKRCDEDHNKVLDADELLRCTEGDGNDIRDTDSHILRGLCVDALISIGSSKNNWVLSQSEFLHLLEPNFVPPTRVCQLEDKKYQDGAETTVDCNICVCACGDWVCTGAPCGQEKDSPGIPGPVTKGSLPTQAQRETFLRGFKAAGDVHIHTVQEEVARKQHAREFVGQLDDLGPL